MVLINAIVGGLLCGAAIAFAIAFISLLPLMGWTGPLANPAFIIVGLLSGVVIGAKSLETQ